MLTSKFPGDRPDLQYINNTCTRAATRLTGRTVIAWEVETTTTTSRLDLVSCLIVLTSRVSVPEPFHGRQPLPRLFLSSRVSQRQI
jgi:hypothetical protein